MTSRRTGTLMGMIRTTTTTMWFWHVAGQDRQYVRTNDGKISAADATGIPDRVRGTLQWTADGFLSPCYKVIPELSRLMVHSWMAALQTERLEQKTEDIKKRVVGCNGSWKRYSWHWHATTDSVSMATLRAMGSNVPLHAIAHHRDNLFPDRGWV